MELKIKVFRYDPQRDKAPEFKEYKLHYEEGMTFLRAFHLIKEKYDESFSFRHFCRAGICGTCTVMVNGFPKLACKEQVLPYVLFSNEVVIEPLANFEVIKDLVVDNEAVIERMRSFRTWVRGVQKEVSIPPEINRLIEKGADCILCSACQSYCPQVLESGYAGPLFFAKLHRLLADPRDGQREFRLKEALEMGNLYHCLSCNKCNNVCPKEVEPATLIRELMVFKDG